ncbi:hypothetical protein AOLI_G00034300 [Acnodon oligacanthus]
MLCVFPVQQEQLLQLQLQQMQKVLHEQNTLLSFLGPGLMLSPSFLTQGNGYSPANEMNLAVQTDSLLNSRKDSSNTVLNRIRLDSEEPACASQPTPQSGRLFNEVINDMSSVSTPLHINTCSILCKFALGSF